LEGNRQSTLMTRIDERTHANLHAMLMTSEVGAALLQAGSGNQVAYCHRSAG
jgi:hypothetical protein